jgi:hypothetical protein
MMVQEVSLVDAAANLRKFVVLKRDGMTTDKTEKMTLKLPSAAKQGIMDGIGQILDKLTALATMVGDAEEDDAAAVPEELGTALMQQAEMLEGMATQYAPAAAAGAEGAEGNPSEATPPAAGGSPDMTGGAPATAGKAANPTSKALPAELHDGDSLKQTLHDGDSLKTLLHKSIAAAHVEISGLDRLDKAGRKIAGARFKKLSDLHDTLGKLLNELAFDEAAEAAAGAGTGAEKGETKKDVSDLATVVKTAQETRETLTAKMAELEARVNKVAAAPASSNAGSLEGGGAAPSDNKWPLDMSESVRKKREARQASGAR